MPILNAEAQKKNASLQDLNCQIINAQIWWGFGLRNRYKVPLFKKLDLPEIDKLLRICFTEIWNKNVTRSLENETKNRKKECYIPL